MDLPQEDALRWLVSRFAHLRHAHGGAIGEPELLEPSGRHFPDPFAPDGPSVARLLARMVGYAPLSPEIEIGIRFVEPEEASGGGGGCGSGSCGTTEARTPKDRVIETGESYIIELPTSDVGHPTLLTTSLARSVGAIVLSEAGEEVDPHELGALSEVAAAASGFGVLLTSGAYVYGKSCGGVRMHRHTHLSVEEHAALLALFSGLHAIKPGAVRSHLETTQREAFAEAWGWVESNPKLMRDLRDRPEVLADGVFAMDPVKGFFGRVIAKRSLPREETPGALSPAAMRTATRKRRTPEEERRLAEARALVEEALRQG